MEKTSYTLGIAGKPLIIETGRLARQATSSVLARLGDTEVLVTVVAGSQRPDLGYFPLMVEYIERLYAGGRIKGSRWVKREGRPSDDSILIARLIDRSIRPLFPKDYKNEVQIIVTVLSVDGENAPDILSIIAVSIALSISKIPWNGPISALRMGVVKEKPARQQPEPHLPATGRHLQAGAMAGGGDGNKEFLINPGGAEIEHSELDLIASQTKEKTVMIEANGNQVPENVALEAIEKAQDENKKIIAFIEKIVKEIGQKKDPVTADTALLETVAKIEKSYKEDVVNLAKNRATKESNDDGASEALIDTIFQALATDDPETAIDKKTISKALEIVLFKNIRKNVLQKNIRVDGRKIDEIRPISGMVSVLPRTHGSGIFERGTTQALTVVTLGSPRLEQLIESAEGEEVKRYIHHYSMPPYSVGETGRIGVPSRREIGHGALAERALEPVIPKQDKFPYTIRVVSEILSSNGSTSMAATCGSTLALMDAGVPIENPVAGVAMGMVSEDDKYIILTDILGLEDFSGDMDFKVAGTEKGITAIQLDVKIPGLTIKQIQETLERAKKGRLFILEKMLSVLPSARPKLSDYAPKIEVVQIPVEKIGEVIGPGGRMIRNIIATTGATVDVEDDGKVTVSGTSEEAVTKATEWIKGLTREAAVGEEFEGEVKRILPFGAFVEILPGKEGMVHVSQMSKDFVKDPHDVVQIGQKVKVRVVEIDEQGRTNLSMLFGADAAEKARHTQQERGGPNEQFAKRPSGPAHPLTMQFRRERAQQTQGRNRGRGRFRPSR